MPCRLLVTFGIAVLLPAVCTAVNNTWIYPDPESTPIYNYIDLLNATWTSNLTETYLVLWCQDASSDNPFYSKYNQTVPASGSRVVTLDYDASALGCHFELVGQDSGFNGGGFLIQVLKDTDPVTWSQETPEDAPKATGTATASQTARTIFPTAAVTALAPTVTKASSGNGGLSSGAKAGIGVGVTLGILAIGAIAAFFVLRSRKPRTQEGHGFPLTEQYKRDPVLYHPVDDQPVDVSRTELGAEQAVPEMAAAEAHHELPTSTKRGYPNHEADDNHRLG